MKWPIHEAYGRSHTRWINVRPRKVRPFANFITCDLQNLVEKNILLPTGGSRSTRYQINL